jgi:hypothetical protein
MSALLRCGLIFLSVPRSGGGNFEGSWLFADMS